MTREASSTTSIEGSVAVSKADPIWPALLAVVAVVFNAGLAVVNGSIMPLGTSHIILAEALIVVSAHAYALTHYNQRMLPWYILIAFAGAFAALRMLAVGSLEVKYFRDLLILQTFVVLGMTTTRQMAARAMLAVCAIVVAGVLLEAISLETYSALFKVKDFYINTRGLVSDDFTNEASDLYISATRPEARYLPFFDLHRLSSIFLEPVSLGNFMIIMVIFVVAYWRQLSGAARLFAVAATVLVLFACDGRLAIASSALILALAAVAFLLPRNIAVVILPLVVLSAVLIVAVGDLYSGQDTVKGRIAYTVELLRDMEMSDYLGLSDRLLVKAVDSGIVYLIITQSVVVVGMLWLLIVVGLDEDDAAQRHYKNGLALYLALTMMVSFSFISIKTAAPLWLLYGALAAAGRTSADAREAQPHLGAAHASPRATG